MRLTADTLLPWRSLVRFIARALGLEAESQVHVSEVRGARRAGGVLVRFRVLAPPLDPGAAARYERRVADLAAAGRFSEALPVSSVRREEEAAPATGDAEPAFGVASGLGVATISAGVFALLLLYLWHRRRKRRAMTLPLAGAPSNVSAGPSFGLAGLAQPVSRAVAPGARPYFVPPLPRLPVARRDALELFKPCAPSLTAPAGSGYSTKSRSRTGSLRAWGQDLPTRPGDSELDDMCVVCLDAPQDAVIVHNDANSSTHQVVCSPCAHRLLTSGTPNSRLCPMCRAPILGVYPAARCTKAQFLASIGRAPTGC